MLNDEPMVVLTAPVVPLVETLPLKVQVSPARMAPVCGVSFTVMLFASALKALADVNGIARVLQTSASLVPSLDVAFLTASVMTGATSRATSVAPAAGATDDSAASVSAAGSGTVITGGVPPPPVPVPPVPLPPVPVPGVLPASEVPPPPPPQPASPRVAANSTAANATHVPPFEPDD